MQKNRLYMESLLRISLIVISTLGMIGTYSYYKGFLYKGEYSQFEGKGTLDSPYLIQDVDDLKNFRDLVNEGNPFENSYFYQSADIDLDGEDWTPIGIFGSNNYFAGIYDGGAHCIQNLMVTNKEEYTPSNGGFFGFLDGTVKNLGIESGEITGDYVGAITSHGTSRVLILNCYNRASVSGTGRAGGICDNISGGAVINCVNYGQVSAPVFAQIVSYDAKYLLGVYPEENAFSDIFSGIYIGKALLGETPRERLNAGIDGLIEEGVLQEEEATKWQ